MKIIKIKSLLSLLVFPILFIPDVAFASSGMAGQSTGAVATSLAPIASLVISISYMLGLILVILGIMGFKKHTQNPQQYTIASSFMSIVSGTLLLIPGLLYGVLKNTTISSGWSTDRSALSMASHTSATMGDVSKSFFANYIPPQTIALLVGFIYLIGLISFIRGIYLLKNIGSNGHGKEGGVAKALTHMLGGVASMNIVDLACIFGKTFGIPLMCG